MLQSTVFGDLFGTAAMREVFGEPALFRNCAWSRRRWRGAGEARRHPRESSVGNLQVANASSPAASRSISNG